jgi:four helix bundle protein
MPKSDLLREYCTQLIRSSSSVRANYIEALEALSKKDFIHRLKISRKETRESVHWLRFIHDTCNLDESKESMVNLISEGNEIKKILSSSILKLETKQLIGD